MEDIFLASIFLVLGQLLLIYAVEDNALANSQSPFKQFEVLICQTQAYPFQCPTGTQIHMETALYGPRALLMKRRVAADLPMGQCPPPGGLRPDSTSPLRQCMATKDVISPLKQLCERKSSCSILPIQFSTNESSCSDVFNEVLVSYRCEPTPLLVKTLTICKDSYMDLKCGIQRSDNVIVMLQASLVLNSDSSPCAKLIDRDGSTNVCASAIEVTSNLRSLCDREKTCSVMPQASMLPGDLPKVCSRRHLQLSYACVALQVLVNEAKSTGTNSNRRGKIQSNLPKKPKREHAPYSDYNSHSSVPERYYDDSSYGPKLSHALNSLHNDRNDNEHQFTDVSRLEDNKPMDTREVSSVEPNSSMYSMVLGVLIGLAFLILLILMAIILGFRNRRAKTAYEQRKAAQEPSSVHKLPESNESVLDGSSINNNYVYLKQQQVNQSQISEEDDGLASTYIPYGESSWPVGLPHPQSMYQRAGYSMEAELTTDGHLTGSVFIKSASPTESHGYMQLPFSSMNDGKCFPLYTSNVSKSNSSNHSSSSKNRAPPYTMQQPSPLTEIFQSKLRADPGGLGNLRCANNSPKYTSCEANSTFSANESTDSDRCSGMASSNLSSLHINSTNTIRQTLLPMSPTFLGNKSPSLEPASTCSPWIGYENGMAAVAVANKTSTVRGTKCNGAMQPANDSSESLTTCLIDPPDNFKNDEDVEKPPPQMGPLKLDSACSGMHRQYNGWNGGNRWTNQV